MPGCHFTSATQESAALAEPMPMKKTEAIRRTDFEMTLISHHTIQLCLTWNLRAWNLQCFTHRRSFPNCSLSPSPAQSHLLPPNKSKRSAQNCECLRKAFGSLFLKSKPDFGINILDEDPISGFENVKTDGSASRSIGTTSFPSLIHFFFNGM